MPYPLGPGRLPTVEFKIAGRIIVDCRVVTAWQPDTTYPQNSYVLAVGMDGKEDIFVQQNTTGVSAATVPSFATVAEPVDGTCLLQNYGQPAYAAGSGLTGLNNPASSKLGGAAQGINGNLGSVLIADAWQGGNSYNTYPHVIEAPIGWLQAVTQLGVSGPNRPGFATEFGGVTTGDGGVNWVCLGRSMYATCLPDPDGTTNQGGMSNPALCIADYLQTPKNQFGLGAVLTGDSIDTVIAAANICDEPVVIEVF
jgi:hypothetical protein